MKRSRTALLSVYEKEGIADFATSLIELEWDILASGGTARALVDAGVPVRDVADLVGGGAILGHKVVTLSRELHAGLLADRDNPDEVAEMDELGLPFIELACVDMYPLSEAGMKDNATLDSIRQSTDIGGPTMLRSAAKGRRIVIAKPQTRARVLSWLQDGEPNSEWFRNELAIEVEDIISGYCKLSSELLRWGARELNESRSQPP